MFSSELAEFTDESFKRNSCQVEQQALQSLRTTPCGLLVANFATSLYNVAEVHVPRRWTTATNKSLAKGILMACLRHKRGLDGLLEAQKGS